MLKIVALLSVLYALSECASLERQKRFSFGFGNDENQMQREIFTFEDCMQGHPDQAIIFEKINITNPLMLPGPAVITFKGRNKHVIRKMDVQVTIERDLSNFWGELLIPIPCVSKVGSCLYKDVCTKMQNRDHEEKYPMLIKMRETFVAAGAPQSCPIPPTNLHVENLVLDLPPLPGILANVAKGTYLTKYEVYNPDKGNKRIGCLKMKVTLAVPKSSSWFGKK